MSVSITFANGTFFTTMGDGRFGLVGFDSSVEGFVFVDVNVNDGVEFEIVDFISSDGTCKTSKK